MRRTEAQFQRLKSFLRARLDGSGRRLLKNVSLLYSGQALSMILGMASLSLMCRILPPAALGTLQLIQTYVAWVESLLGFQSWQSVIRYGAAAITDQDDERLHRFLKVAFLVDAAAAAVAALVVIGSVWSVGSLWHWSVQEKQLASIAGLCLITHISGSPTGILRLFNRFDLIVRVGVVASVVRCILLGVALYAWPSFSAVFLIWLVSDIYSKMSLLLSALAELRRAGHGGWWRCSLKGVLAQNPGLIRFMVSTNLQGSVRLAVKSTDVFVLGALVGPEAVALWTVAKKISSPVAMAVDPLCQVIYPEAASLWSEGRVVEFNRLLRRTARLGAAPGLAVLLTVLLAGGWILTLIGGDSYRAAYSALTWQCLGMGVWCYSSPLPSGLLAIGRADALLWTTTLTAVLYLIMLLALTRVAGIAGTGMAYAAYMAVTAFSMQAALVLYQRQTELSAVAQDHKSDAVSLDG